jgi:hypothetical protein
MFTDVSENPHYSGYPPSCTLKMEAELSVTPATSCRTAQPPCKPEIPVTGGRMEGFEASVCWTRQAHAGYVCMCVCMYVCMYVRVARWPQASQFKSAHETHTNTGRRTWFGGSVKEFRLPMISLRQKLSQSNFPALQPRLALNTARVLTQGSEAWVCSPKGCAVKQGRVMYRNPTLRAEEFYLHAWTAVQSGKT